MRARTLAHADRVRSDVSLEIDNNSAKVRCDQTEELLTYRLTLAWELIPVDNVLGLIGSTKYWTRLTINNGF